MSLNRIIVMGRLTADPTLRTTQSGVSAASFTIAVDRDFKTRDGERTTDFIDCTAWRAAADFISKYFTKGRMIVVDGRLQMRHWKDKDDNNRVSAEIVVDNAYFGDSTPAEKTDKPAGRGSTNADAQSPAKEAAAAPAPSAAAADDDSDDTPF